MEKTGRGVTENGSKGRRVIENGRKGRVRKNGRKKEESYEVSGLLLGGWPLSLIRLVIFFFFSLVYPDKVHVPG